MPGAVCENMTPRIPDAGPGAFLILMLRRWFPVGNAGIAPRLTIGHHWPGVPERERWATK